MAGAVLIAETAMATCEAAVKVIGAETSTPAERWRAVMALHDQFPEVWTHLDRARRELAARGANTIAYDELRPKASRTAVEALEDQVDKKAVKTDALADARRGIEALKLAVPGTDWRELDARTSAAANAVPVRSYMRPRLVAGIGAVMGSLVVLFAFSITTPGQRAHAATAAQTRAEMKREISEIREDRHEEIAELKMSMTKACEPQKAHALIRLLVLDGRNPEAKTFGEHYQESCGDDPLIEQWVKAPDPHKYDRNR